MQRVMISVQGLQCERCKHEWIPRDINVLPKVCPSCKSPYWNTPRKVKSEANKRMEDNMEMRNA